MKKSNTLKLTFIGIGGIGMLLTSYTLIYDLLIPDACYYHMNELNPFIGLFYSSNPASNGHPEPNILNLLISISVGGILGIGIYKILTNEK